MIWGTIILFLAFIAIFTLSFRYAKILDRLVSLIRYFENSNVIDKEEVIDL